MSKKAIKRYESNNPFLVVVDIQPSYHPGSYQVVPDIIDKLNTTKQNIFFFYVGRDFGLDSKEDVIMYLLENGLDEDKIKNIKFIEKTYGYYRNWIDSNIEDDVIIRAIKIMKNENINDSRDFEEKHWSEIISNSGVDRFFLEQNSIHDIDFNADIFKYPEVNNFELVGGGRQECLKELELYLKAIGKDLVINEKLCYGDNYFSYENDYKALKKMNKI